MPTEPIRITVLGDTAPLSANRTRRLHWSALHRLQNLAKLRAHTAWIMARKPSLQGPWPVRVDVIIRRGRKLDRDNAVSSLKATIDGLFKGRVTPDDSEAFLDMRMPVQETGARWEGREEVEFVVWPGELGTPAQGRAGAL